MLGRLNSVQAEYRCPEVPYVIVVVDVSRSVRDSCPKNDIFSLVVLVALFYSVNDQLTKAVYLSPVALLMGESPSKL